MERPASVTTHQDVMIDLLEAILLEETALAAFMHAEVKHLRAVFRYIRGCTGRLTAEEILQLQGTISSVLQAARSMQLLLNSKADSILNALARDMLYVPGEEKPGKVSRLVPGVFRLTGSGHGPVGSVNDLFFQGTASVLEARVAADNGCFTEGTLAYRVARQGVVQRLTALPRTLSVFCDGPYSRAESCRRYIVTGRGATDQFVTGCPPVADDCRFSLTVETPGAAATGLRTFQVAIMAHSNAQLNHNSGLVRYQGNLQEQSKSPAGLS